MCCGPSEPFYLFPLVSDSLVVWHSGGCFIYKAGRKAFFGKIRRTLEDFRMNTFTLYLYINQSLLSLVEIIVYTPSFQTSLNKNVMYQQFLLFFILKLAACFLSAGVLQTRKDSAFVTALASVKIMYYYWKLFACYKKHFSQNVNTMKAEYLRIIDPTLISVEQHATYQ